MPNDNRLAKINEEITRELSRLIPRLKDPRIGKGLLSITRVDTSRDMRHAKIYVSILQKDADCSAAIKGLVSASGFLRRELSAALSLRMTPELQFIADDSIEQGSHILELLHNIREDEQNSKTRTERE